MSVAFARSGVDHPEPFDPAQLCLPPQTHPARSTLPWNELKCVHPAMANDLFRSPESTSPPGLRSPNVAAAPQAPGLGDAATRVGGVGANPLPVASTCAGPAHYQAYLTRWPGPAGGFTLQQ